MLLTTIKMQDYENKQYGSIAMKNAWNQNETGFNQSVFSTGEKGKLETYPKPSQIKSNWT